MVLREQFNGTIVGMQDGQVVVQLDDGAELVCGSGRDLHRKWGFFSVPTGQRVKVSRDVATHERKARIVEILR
jgi:hypothetical protein